MTIKSIILALVACASGLAQIVTNFAMPGGYVGSSSISVTLSAEATAAVHERVKQELAPNIGIGTITLSTTVNSSVTTIVPSSTTGIVVGMGFMIGTEMMVVTSTSGSITVIRGTCGTTAASHTSGDAMSVMKSGDIPSWVKNFLADAVAKIMVLTPGPTISGAQSTISTELSTAVQ